MNEQNQPEELPDYLRNTEGNTENNSESNVDAAKAWAEAFAEANGEGETGDSQTEETTPTTIESTTSTVEGDENTGGTPMTSEENVAEDEGFATSEPMEGDSVSDTSTQAWSAFLNEKTLDEMREDEAGIKPTPEVAPNRNEAPEVASSPAKPEPESEPQPEAKPETEPTVTSENATSEPETTEAAEDLENTVVRRKSLLGAQPEEVIGATAAAEADEAEIDPRWQPRQAQMLGNDDKKLNESTMLAGASIKPGKISRAGAHLWSLIVCLLGVPLVWAFLGHSSGLLFGSKDASWDTGTYSLEGLLFLVAGLVLIILIGSIVRLSSLGMFVTGILMTVLGGAFVAVPGVMKDVLSGPLANMQDHRLMAVKILGYLVESAGASGQFLVIGVVLIMIGVIGHSARRHGRVDQIADKALSRAGIEEA